PSPAAQLAWDDDPGGLRHGLPDGPPGGRARRRRTALALRARSVRRRRQPYPAVTNQPPALTAGGPMNGVRSPLWNPYIMGGRPFLANSESAVFSPFSVPAYVLPFWKSLAFIAALKLFVAA